MNWHVVSKDKPDAWLYFYEDFLQVYDSALRRRTGSYYTPPEVVDAMVRLCDEALHSDLFERANQGDLFNPDPQGALFDEDALTTEYRADPDKVRAELLRLLAQARAAQTLPWDRKRGAYYRVVFPQMANWLPDDEAAQLRFDFEAELIRLRAA